MNKYIEQLVGKLPTYPDILGRDKYFNSAVLISLVIIEEELNFLFEVRQEGIRQGGEICFPGGHHDLIDGSFLETALRETEEELGVRRNDIQILGRMDTLVAAMGAVVEGFVGLLYIESVTDLKINPEEVANVFAMPVAYFIQNPPEIHHVRVEIKSSYINELGEEVVLLPVESLGLPKRYGTPWGGLNQRIYVYKTPFGPIWGLTAELVHQVVFYLQ